MPCILQVCRYRRVVHSSSFLLTSHVDFLPLSFALLSLTFGFTMSLCSGDRKFRYASSPPNPRKCRSRLHVAQSSSAIRGRRHLLLSESPVYKRRALRCLVAASPHTHRSRISSLTRVYRSCRQQIPSSQTVRPNQSQPRRQKRTIIKMQRRTTSSSHPDFGWLSSACTYRSSSSCW